jgi:integrase
MAVTSGRDAWEGRKGRPSRALNLSQATSVLEKAQQSSLHAYVAVSLMTGIRTEEARELRWDHVVTRDNEEAPCSRSPRPASITRSSPCMSGVPSAWAATPRPRSHAAP